MEDQTDSLKNNEEPLNLSGETESITSEDSSASAVLYPFHVENETLLVRMVPKKWIRKDNSITSDAYRPKKKEYGLERNVSTAPKSYFNSEDDLDQYNSRRNHKLFEMRAQFPNERNYPCIQDKEKHIGITGDMVILFEDEESLEHFANNSELLHPIT